MSNGGFLRGPASTQTSAFGSGAQSRIDEPEASPQQRDEDRAHADLGRAMQFASNAKKLDPVPAAEWAEKKAALEQHLTAARRKAKGAK